MSSGLGLGLDLEQKPAKTQGGNSPFVSHHGETVRILRLRLLLVHLPSFGTSPDLHHRGNLDVTVFLRNFNGSFGSKKKKNDRSAHGTIGSLAHQHAVRGVRGRRGVAVTGLVRVSGN